MSRLAYVDCETTGLDARVHEPWELCWWLEDEPDPHTMLLPHSLDYADPMALKVGGYWERTKGPWDAHEGADRHIRARVARALRGVTLVGANPAFDAAMLTRFIGTPVWHYRMVDVSTVAMTVYDWDRPKSLADTADAMRELGWVIHVPDHTAEADVRTTRAVYEALRDEIRGRDTVDRMPTSRPCVAYATCAAVGCSTDAKLEVAHRPDRVTSVWVPLCSDCFMETPEKGLTYVAEAHGFIPAGTV